MSNELETLARRAVACKHWKWLPGMLYTQGGHGVRPVIATAPITQGGGLPDLSDPATLGCLLALVREAWGQPTIATRYSEYQDRGGEWDVPTPIEQNRMRDILFFTGEAAP